MAVQDLPMTILNALKTFYPKKELNFIIMTNWALAIRIYLPTPHYGIFPAMWKKWNRSAKDSGWIIFIYLVIHGAVCWPWNTLINIKVM